jgi:hypothetical protein
MLRVSFHSNIPVTLIEIGNARFTVASARALRSSTIYRSMEDERAGAVRALVTGSCTRARGGGSAW